MTGIKLLMEAKCFGGRVRKYQHFSNTLQCAMNFSVYIPKIALEGESVDVPVLFFLSGLTCNEDNFITKSGACAHAARLGILLVCPDTSPRQVDIPGQEDSWDLGTGAGFYVDATRDPWNKHYKMYSYVTEEMVSIVQSHFHADMERVGIFGHSMGGHGALICALKNPGKYKSVSAFAPVCHPTISPWGKKAFQNYLNNEQEFAAYDATCLVSQYSGPVLDILIDQGSKDEFLLSGQLNPDAFAQAAAKGDNVEVTLRIREGYDHGYWFVQTFIGEHMEHHARWLNDNAMSDPTTAAPGVVTAAVEIEKA